RLADDERDVSALHVEGVRLIGADAHLRCRHDEEVRKVASLHAEQRGHAIAPLLSESEAIAAVYLVADTPGERTAHDESGSPDDAVEFVLDAAGEDSPVGNGLDPTSVRVDQGDVWTVEI